MGGAAITARRRRTGQVSADAAPGTAAPMRADVEVRIAAVARTQHGHVTVRQLTEAGMSPSTRRRRAAAGLLAPVGAHTFRLASAPSTPIGSLMAACLDTGGVASHRSAAWVHGLRAHPPPRPEVTVPKGRLPGRKAAGDLIVHTSTSLPEEDILTVRYVPVMSIARTFLGLAALIPDGQDRAGLLSMVEAAVADNRASDRWLWWHLERRRIRGRDGVRALESILAERAGLGPTESWLERELLRVLDGAGVPRPAIQRVVRAKGRFAARVDFLYEAEKIVIEVMGHRWHAPRERLQADAERVAMLQLEGHLVIPVTYDQLVSDPDSVVELVRRARAQRQP